MKSTTDIASAHGAKTVSAGHLRASIMGNEKFDFLKDVVEEFQIFLHQRQALGSQRMLLLAGKIVQAVKVADCSDWFSRG